ncbi:unnamed protein product [Staurois parvus]|uniref:Coiled-coil domain-containing protein 57 n=1 Tax=Staurois parvus TaxID=386267 RepID=A0ABN9DB65_9NEOB|nr:unnamed protein product [Staurois parvus]
MFSQLKVVTNAKLCEVSELKVKIEKLQQELQREKKNVSDLQNHCQRKIKEHQIELDQVHGSKNSDIDRLLEEYEKLKRQLERRIEELEGDLALQKQELSLEFDCELKKREHDFRVGLDEMNTVVLSHELKVKLLTKELNILREKELKGTESLQQAQLAIERLHEALRHKDFEMKDVLVVKEARIKELEGNIQKLQHQLEREKKAFQLKHEQLDHGAREKESALASMKEAHNEQIQQLDYQKKELQRCVETLQMEQQRATYNHQAVLEEKESTIMKLKDDVDTLKTGWDSHITQLSQKTVNKDLQIQSLQEKEEKLKVQIAKYQKDMERYQQQLAGSVERERLLEQARVQVELDWQKRCEEIEKTQYQRLEELIEGLSIAKDQLEVELKEKDRILNELQLVNSTVTWERDKAVATIRKQGTLTHIGEKTLAAMPDFVSSEIQKLQEQNSELRQVIGQMRKEMEMLCEQMSPAVGERTEPPSANTGVTAPSTDYLKSFVEEIKDVKQRNREMEVQLQLSPPLKDPPDPPTTSKPVLPDNVYIQTRIRNSNETIGALGADEVACAGAAKRLESRTAQLDSMVAELNQKNEAVNRLQEEVMTLQQQMATLTTLGHGSTNPYILKTKLKEAEKKISRLIMESQQLTEIENGLRAKVAPAEAKTSKHLVTVTPSFKVQAPKPLSRLSELESLQYQLTSQELQFAQYQKSPRLSTEDHSTTKAKPCGHSDSFAVQTTEDTLPMQKENLFSPRVNYVSSARSLRSAASLTEGDSSLQEVWKILDMGSSVSLLSSQEGIEQALPGKAQMGNHKKVPSSAIKKNVDKTGRPGNAKQTRGRGTPKIRNYNIRD